MKQGLLAVLIFWVVISAMFLSVAYAPAIFFLVFGVVACSALVFLSFYQRPHSPGYLARTAEWESRKRK